MRQTPSRHIEHSLSQDADCIHASGSFGLQHAPAWPATIFQTSENVLRKPIFSCFLTNFLLTRQTVATFLSFSRSWKICLGTNWINSLFQLHIYVMSKTYQWKHCLRRVDQQWRPFLSFLAFEKLVEYIWNQTIGLTQNMKKVWSKTCQYKHRTKMEEK